MRFRPYSVFLFFAWLTRLRVLGLVAVGIRVIHPRAATAVAYLLLTLPILTGVVSQTAHAQASVPNTFNDGDPALAGEVNENFQALVSAIDELSETVRTICLETGGVWDDGTCSAAFCGSASPSPGDAVSGDNCTALGGTVRPANSYACTTYGTRCNPDCAHTVEEFFWVPISCAAIGCDLTDNTIFNYICD